MTLRRYQFGSKDKPMPVGGYFFAVIGFEDAGAAMSAGSAVMNGSPDGIYRGGAERGYAPPVWMAFNDGGRVDHEWHSCYYGGIRGEVFHLPSGEIKMTMGGFAAYEDSERAADAVVRYALDAVADEHVPAAAAA